MEKSYVERRKEGLYLTGSRMPLDFIVREFQQGEPPECIVMHYQALTLEKVYGAITWYLAHKEETEEAMRERIRDEEEFIAAHPSPPHLKERFAKAREEVAARQR